MVDDLTFATTLEAGKLSPLCPRAIHLPSALNQVIEAVNAVEQKGGRAVEIRTIMIGVPIEAQSILADQYLSRVVYSLLSNAVRYSPANGHHVDFTITYTPGALVQTNDDLIAVGSKRRMEANINDTSKFTKDVNGNAQSISTVGSYTFSFTNVTVVPMDLMLVRNYFSYYYHFDSLATGELSVAEESLNLVSLVNTSGMEIMPTCPVSSSGFGPTTVPHVSNSTSYKDLVSTKGLGLGLYTAYNMVKLLGGQLECSVSKPDTACFWFTLSLPMCATAVEPSKPLKLSHPDPVPPVPVPTGPGCVPSPLTAPSAVRQIRVLVVDDSSMCRKVIVKSLTGQEFETDVASNGKEACDKLQDRPCKFDAVLMDLRMPVMDGLEAIRYCREILKLETLPIISLTAEIGSTIRDEAINAGASHFMNKPAKGNEIISLLRSLMIRTA